MGLIWTLARYDKILPHPPALRSFQISAQTQRVLRGNDPLFSLSHAQPNPKPTPVMLVNVCTSAGFPSTDRHEAVNMPEADSYINTR